MQKTYITDSRLITVDDVCLYAEFDYIPKEKGIYRDRDGAGVPDMPPQVQLLKAYAGEVDIFNLLSQSQIEDIEIQILESYD